MNEQILTVVEAVLLRAGVLRPEATLLVALSGGADSVALFRAVCQLAEVQGFAVRAAHVEHGLRGEASMEDARFCQRLCAGLGVPLTLDFAGLVGGMAAPGTEARAREARYRLLLDRARECRADALLLAHHMDDQAETVISHLIRGSGAHGLGGMREAVFLEGVLLLRPLLTLPKQTLLDALEGIPYREDASNAEPCCQRNRMRAGVMPLLTAENPRAAEHIAQSAALLALDEDCLQAQADALLNGALTDSPPFLCVRKEPFLAAQDAVIVRALRCFAELGMARLAAGKAVCAVSLSPLAASTLGAPWLDDSLLIARPFSPAPVAGKRSALFSEHSLSASESLALLGLLRAPEGATLNLPHGLRATVTARRMHITRMADGSPVSPVPTPPPLPLDGAEGMLRFGSFLFRLAAYHPQADTAPDGIRSVVVPNSLLARAVFRVMAAGDHIRPFGAGGGKPLRRYLTDHKLDPPFRPALPLLCVDGEVLWAVGVGAAEGTRITDAPSTTVTLEAEPST